MKSQHPTFATLESLEHRLPTLATLPVRFVWGMRDWCFRPECLYRLQKLLPNHKSVELSEMGHYVMEEAPDQVLAAIHDVHAELGSGEFVRGELERSDRD